MRPDDITLLAACGPPSLVPDGSAAVVSITAPSLTDDEQGGALWLVPTVGGAPRRLTRGHHDTAPAVSPDGAWVAFCRREPGGRPQLALVETGGGEPVLLTAPATHPLGVGAPVWSPAGAGPARLAYAARVPEPGRYGTGVDGGLLEGPAASPDREAPRLVTMLANRLDGVGHTPDRPRHLFVLDVSAVTRQPGRAARAGEGSPPASQPSTGLPWRVTSGDTDDGDPAWTRDGRALLYAASARARGDGPEDLRVGAYRVQVPGGGDVLGAGDGPAVEVPAVDVPAVDAEPAHEPELVLGGDLAVTQVVPDPSGAGVLALAGGTGPDGLDVVARPGSLWWAPFAAGGAPRRLTEPSLDLGEPSARLVATGSGALVLARVRGAQHLLHVLAPDPDDATDDADDPADPADPVQRDDGAGPADGGGARAVEPQLLLGGHRTVLAADATADGSVVVAVVADGASPGDLVRLHGAAIVPLTDVAAPLRAAGVRPMRELTATAPDGYEVHGWVVLPASASFGQGPHPTVLMIHGGPFSAFTWSVLDEAQVLAGAGYAVVLGNPRGSAGYGEEHGRAVVGAMGGPDADDVTALLDAALADDGLGLDPGRVGVMGGSYGGYLTALLTTRTHRFAGAIVERGYLDAVSFVGSSDIGWFFPDAYHRSREAMVEQSPMTHVAEVTTPTLVIHSEDDLRCPLEQGQRWFTELRRAGVDTSLLLFPGEGHELSRSGRPSHRVARHQHVLRWWHVHLPVATGG